jgi:hypothetical protein
MRNKLFAIAILSSILFFACKKKDSDSGGGSNKTKPELLVQKSWKFDNAKAGNMDITTSVPACLKDNIFTFSSNLNLTVSEETTVCSPSYAGTYTWSFQNNETVLQVSGSIFPGGSGDFAIVSLDETNLVLSQPMTIPPYPTTTVQVTLKH